MSQLFMLVSICVMVQLLYIDIFLYVGCMCDFFNDIDFSFNSRCKLQGVELWSLAVSIRTFFVWYVITALSCCFCLFYYILLYFINFLSVCSFRYASIIHQTVLFFFSLLFFNFFFNFFLFLLFQGVEPRWKGLNTAIPVVMVSKRTYR